MRLNLNKLNPWRSTTHVALLGVCALLSPAFVACGSATGAADGQRLIVVTTGHIHDAVASIIEGTDIEVKLLCGPGVDPHSYSASTRDVLAMQRAKLVVYNGFHLEAQLSDLLDRDAFAAKAWSMAGAFPIENRLDWIEDGEVDPSAPIDPHIWNDLDGWSTCVTALSAHLGTIFPDDATGFIDNGTAYVAAIREADQWASEILAQLPESRRVLVSGHDAFNYFARRYGLETIAVLGVGNDPEADLRTMRSVAETVSQRQVPVIFLESITNPKLTRALQESCVARGWCVEIADEPLYSDDLGDREPVDTFLGAFRTNVATISAALGG